MNHYVMTIIYVDASDKKQTERCSFPTKEARNTAREKVGKIGQASGWDEDPTVVKLGGMENARKIEFSYSSIEKVEFSEWSDEEFNEKMNKFLAH